jgi:hypothetical protein
VIEYLGFEMNFYKMIDLVKPNIKFSYLYYENLEKITEDNVKTIIELFDNFLKYVSFIQEGVKPDTLTKKSISKFCSINLMSLKGLKKDSDSSLPIYRIFEDCLTEKNILNYMSNADFEDYCTDGMCNSTRDLFRKKYSEICVKHLGIVLKEEPKKPEVSKKQESKSKTVNLKKPDTIQIKEEQSEKPENPKKPESKSKTENLKNKKDGIAIEEEPEKCELSKKQDSKSSSKVDKDKLTIVEVTEKSKTPSAQGSKSKNIKIDIVNYNVEEETEGSEITKKQESKSTTNLKKGINNFAIEEEPEKKKESKSRIESSKTKKDTPNNEEEPEKPEVLEKQEVKSKTGKIKKQDGILNNEEVQKPEVSKKQELKSKTENSKNNKDKIPNSEEEAEKPETPEKTDISKSQKIKSKAECLDKQENIDNNKEEVSETPKKQQVKSKTKDLKKQDNNTVEKEELEKPKENPKTSESKLKIESLDKQHDIDNKKEESETLENSKKQEVKSKTKNLKKQDNNTPKEEEPEKPKILKKSDPKSKIENLEDQDNNAVREEESETLENPEKQEVKSKTKSLKKQNIITIEEESENSIKLESKSKTKSFKNNKNSIAIEEESENSIKSESKSKAKSSKNNKDSIAIEEEPEKQEKPIKSESKSKTKGFKNSKNIIDSEEDREEEAGKPEVPKKQQSNTESKNQKNNKDLFYSEEEADKPEVPKKQESNTKSKNQKNNKDSEEESDKPEVPNKQESKSKTTKNFKNNKVIIDSEEESEKPKVSKKQESSIQSEKSNKDSIIIKEDPEKPEVSKKQKSKSKANNLKQLQIATQEDEFIKPEISKKQKSKSKTDKQVNVAMEEEQKSGVKETGKNKKKDLKQTKAVESSSNEDSDKEEINRYDSSTLSVQLLNTFEYLVHKESEEVLDAKALKVLKALGIKEKDLFGKKKDKTPKFQISKQESQEVTSKQEEEKQTEKAEEQKNKHSRSRSSLIETKANKPEEVEEHTEEKVEEKAIIETKQNSNSKAKSTKFVKKVILLQEESESEEESEESEEEEIKTVIAINKKSENVKSLSKQIYSKSGKDNLVVNEVANEVVNEVANEVANEANDVVNEVVNDSDKLIIIEDKQDQVDDKLNVSHSRSLSVNSEDLNVNDELSLKQSEEIHININTEQEKNIEVIEQPVEEYKESVDLVASEEHIKSDKVETELIINTKEVSEKEIQQAEEVYITEELPLENKELVSEAPIPCDSIIIEENYIVENNKLPDKTEEVNIILQEDKVTNLKKRTHEAAEVKLPEEFLDVQLIEKSKTHEQIHNEIRFDEVVAEKSDIYINYSNFTIDDFLRLKEQAQYEDTYLSNTDRHNYIKKHSYTDDDIPSYGGSVNSEDKELRPRHSYNSTPLLSQYVKEEITSNDIDYSQQDFLDNKKSKSADQARREEYEKVYSEKNYYEDTDILQRDSRNHNRNDGHNSQHYIVENKAEQYQEHYYINTQQDVARDKYNNEHQYEIQQPELIYQEPVEEEPVFRRLEEKDVSHLFVKIPKRRRKMKNSTAGMDPMSKHIYRQKQNRNRAKLETIHEDHGEYYHSEEERQERRSKIHRSVILDDTVNEYYNDQTFDSSEYNDNGNIYQRYLSLDNNYIYSIHDEALKKREHHIDNTERHQPTSNSSNSDRPNNQSENQGIKVLQINYQNKNQSQGGYHAPKEEDELRRPQQDNTSFDNLNMKVSNVNKVYNNDRRMQYDNSNITPERKLDNNQIPNKHSSANEIKSKFEKEDPVNTRHIYGELKNTMDISDYQEDIYGSRRQSDVKPFVENYENTAQPRHSQINQPYKHPQTVKSSTYEEGPKKTLSPTKPYSFKDSEINDIRLEPLQPHKANSVRDLRMSEMNFNERQETESLNRERRPSEELPKDEIDKKLKTVVPKEPVVEVSDSFDSLLKKLKRKANDSFSNDANNTFSYFDTSFTENLSNKTYNSRDPNRTMFQEDLDNPIIDQMLKTKKRVEPEYDEMAENSKVDTKDATYKITSITLQRNKKDNPTDELLKSSTHIPTMRNKSRSPDRNANNNVYKRAHKEQAQRVTKVVLTKPRDSYEEKIEERNRVHNQSDQYDCI